ncbi:SAM-dependent DNA methyltransferase [Prescottella equi]|uniref:Eco57I restriction-modification methylase domain-containing protein n=1 Tax=Rhodococcus hoagii TaxID=43767 RepID=UPI002577825E|nr:DNA methyltransferase [Prescottella equi]WJJ09976.1 SAM-dependent DNA methyltransferase [Prescottella equi]
MALQTRRTPTPNAADLHRGWLQLVDTEGPFLAVPPLKRVWPNGIPDFRKTHPGRFDVLANARKWFESAWEALDRSPDSESALDSYRAARDEWIETVLRDVAGWSESLSWGEVPGVQAQSPNRAVTVTAQAALRGADGIGALVHVVDPVDSLRQTPSDLWAATPVDRLEELLRKSKCDIGVVTDGRWWGLVYASKGSMAASGIVDALTWIEEPRTRDAFLTLIGRQHIIGGEVSERLPVLFEESVAAAEEITEALGAQVRRAVELLIQSFSESAADARRRGLPDPLPTHTHDTYEAAVTVMMRVVFLLFAEERGLLPTGELFEQGYGISRELARLAARESDESEEALDSTSLTWHRLLATSAALYSGATFENMRMPAYGGSLFDPERFPFLTAANEQGALAVTVTDRVMLHVLRSVQLAVLKGGEARQISFRDIDVEQIGYIYEGLLGYTCATVDEVYLGLLGKTGEEPEMPLSTLEALADANPDPKKLAAAIREWVGRDQPSATTPSASAIAKAVVAKVDPSVVSALTQAVGDDHDLHKRVRPWLGLVRRDLRKYPFVVLAGGLLVKETPSRKNAGAHYTPKSLAEEVVLHALQPLCYSPGPHETADKSTWRLKSSREILNLKVADIACGSGAFLVAGARYLAARVVEAWKAEDHENTRRTDLSTWAVREVVANCLYGADINDMAVEMCKLSLWLVSLDRDLPFSFVDDKIFLGNSLIGLTSLDQLRKLHIDPTRRTEMDDYEFYDIDIDSTINEAVAIRQLLADVVEEGNPARNSSAKRRQLAELHTVTGSLRLIADGVVAAGLPLGGKPGRALDDAYENLREAVKAAFPEKAGVINDSAWLDKIIDGGLTPSVATDYERWRPLHWVLEAPDVIVDRGGFDAIVGNPPFVAGGQISDVMGPEVRGWFVSQVAEGTAGAADLSAYFARRYAQLTNTSGTVGFIATNTLAQGDTREVGLDQLVGNGWEIVRGIRSMDWPTASASVACALAWLTAGKVASDVGRWCDGVLAHRISPMLEPEGRISGMPARLEANKKIAFKGSNVYGSGFVLDQAEAVALIAADPVNSEVVFDFPDGKQDINGKADQKAGRYVINFRRWSREKAQSFAEPFDRVERLVKPERASNARPARRDRWWQFGDYAGGLEDSTRGLDDVIAIVIVSKTVMPCLLPARQVFNHGICVFATDRRADLAVLSSSVHQTWAIKYGSGMRNDPRYTPSDVFETFPRPESTEWLTDIGQTLDEERREIMLRRNLGLTKLYNLMNDPEIAGTADPDIARMRSIHVELDEAVVNAYGWSGIPLDHGFHTYRQMERWTVSPAARVEILDRLLEENHCRAAAEAALSRGSIKGSKSKVVSEGQGTLL